MLSSVLLLCTLCTLYNVQYTLQRAMCTVYCYSVQAVHCTLYTVQCTLTVYYIVHCALYNVQIVHILYNHCKYTFCRERIEMSVYYKCYRYNSTRYLFHFYLSLSLFLSLSLSISLYLSRSVDVAIV